MRNLYLLDYYLHKFQVDKDTVEAFYLDEFSYTLYILLQEKILLMVSFNKAELRTITANQTMDLSTEMFSGDKVINMRYIQESESLVLVTQGGEIFQVKPSNKSINNVGSIEGGILAASWSPNEERLVIASKNKALLIFDPEFDPKNETTIDDGADASNTETNPIDSMTISWRGDAKFFTTSYSLGNGRKSLTRDINLAVFKSAAKPDAEGGVVKSVSETPVANIQKPLAYQPSGGIIASFEKVTIGENKHKGQIIFWEKNGLRHGEFVLPYLTDGKVVNESANETNLDVEYMEWNKESDLLALWAKDTQGKEYVLVYYRSNYRWFLKRVIESYTNEKIVGFNWSYVHSYRLFIVYEKGHFEIVDLWLDYCISTRNNYMTNDLAWVVSLDYSTLLCTPTFRAIIPPPMCFTEIKTGGYINDLAVSRNHVVAVQNGSIKLFEFDDSTKQFKASEVQIESDSQLLNTKRPRHLRFLRTHTTQVSGQNVYGLLVFVYNQGEKVMVGEIALALKGDKFSVVSTKSVEVGGQITGIQQSHEYCHNNVGDYVLCQYRSGDIYQFNLGESNPWNQYPLYKRPEMFTSFYEIELDGNKITVGLTPNLRLYLDTKLVSSECTSLALYGDFIAFTTLSAGLSHILYIYNIHDLKFKTFLHAENPQALLPKLEDKTYNLRAVERGSVLVGISNDRVTLQMPRGNLEGISPRLLLLYRIKSYILSSEYRKAYEILRQQKIDLNLLFDINVEAFLEKGELIVTQIEKVDYLNLFLTSVKDDLSEDLEHILTSDEIKHNREALTKHTSGNTITKTKLICDLMIKSLSKVDRDRYILSIMTAHIRENELAVVLDEVIKLKDQGSDETEVKVPPHLDPATMKKHKPAKQLNYRDVLEYVCWIADADRLYEFSLATYNLDLVAMVAQQTQKDPKEYIPYLDALKEMKDPVEMKYKVTMDLKRYDKAVYELSKGNEEQIERSFALIQKHHLYHYGLKLYAQNEKISHRIKEALGDYLMGQKEYKMAGLVLESCGSYKKALEAFKHARNAKKFINVLDLLKLSKEETEQKIKECIEHFTEKSAHNEIAEIYLHYYPKEKLSEIAQCYAKTGNWLALTSIAQRSEEVKEKVIIPAIKLEANLKINALLEKTSEYQTKLQRLQGVQEKKRLMPLIMGANPDFQFDSDATSDFSDVTSSSRRSATSKGSAASTSSKGSRKSKAPKNLLKRKVKEGSILEEEYLVGTLNLLKFSEKLKDEYEDFMQYLIYFGFYEQAERIHELLEKHAELTNKKIKEIKQLDFEAEHPELAEIYPDLDEFKELQPLSANLFSKFKFVKGSK